MTATADAEAAANELMPLAEYLGSVLRRLRALPPLDLDLTQAHGNVLAAERDDLGEEFRSWLAEFVAGGAKG